MNNLDRTVRSFAERLTREFPREIAQDPPAFKRRVVHDLKVSLPPYPGRPALESVSKATELREKKKAWREVYCACIPGYADLDRPNRHLAEYNLRAAVRSRRNARRRRKRGESIPLDHVSPKHLAA